MRKPQSLSEAIVNITVGLTIAELVGQVVIRQLEAEKVECRVWRNFRNFWIYGVR